MKQKIENLEVALPRYSVLTEDGQWHECWLNHFSPLKIPDRGIVIRVWFLPTLVPIDPPLYGPYIFTHLDGEYIFDDRVKFKNVRAERKIEEILARVEGMKYQTTPLLVVGGDAEDARKIYKKEP